MRKRNERAIQWRERCYEAEAKLKIVERQNKRLKDKIEFLQSDRRYRASFGKGKWKVQLKKHRKELNII